MLALGDLSLDVVVVVVVSFVVSHPTNAIAHTPRTTGMSFFMAPILSARSFPFELFFCHEPRRRGRSTIDKGTRAPYYWLVLPPINPPG